MIKNQPLNIQPTHETKNRFFYGYAIVALAFIVMVMAYGSRTAFGVFFKPLLTEFDWTRALTSGALSASLVVQGLLSPVMGNLTDRLGSRRVLMVCGFFLGVGYLLISRLSAGWQLYLFYALIIGIGMSGVFAPMLSMVARWFVQRRSVMTGIVFAGAGAGNLIVAPVANWLLSSYGWRTSFVIMGGIVLVILLLAAQFLRRDPSKMGQSSYGEDKVRENKSERDTGGLSLGEAVVTRQYWLTFAVIFSLGLCTWIILAHVVPYATDLGISTATAANILATMGGATVVGGVVLGHAADRIGIRKVYILGFILMVVSMFCLISITQEWIIFLLIIIFGFGSAGATTLMSPIVAELFGLRAHGSILGVMMFAFTFGGAIGPFVAGYLFDVTGSYQFSFLFSAIFAVIGLISSLTLKPIKKVAG